MRIGWTIWLPLMLCILFTGQLLLILLTGPGSGSVVASCVLALGFAILAIWQISQRRPHHDLEDARAMPAPPSAIACPLPVAPRRALPPGVQAERRRHPRLSVDWPGKIVWHQAGEEATRLQDLSRGGARLVHARQVPSGRRGLLLVPGLSLPVPFTIVASSPVTGLHIRFDLEGMGLDELEQQLQALTAEGEGTGRV